LCIGKSEDRILFEKKKTPERLYERSTNPLRTLYEGSMNALQKPMESAFE
jgi:hypothetical protein